MVGLQFQLLVARFGSASLLAAGLMVLAATGHFAVTPALREAADANRRAHSAVRAAPAATDAAQQLTARYGEFRGRLVPLEERVQHLKTLFQVAADAGVSLMQGDYRLRPEADCDCQALQVTLPLRGTYPQVRAVVDAALAKLPALSLDEISFRRDTVKTLTVDARVRFTLYLKESD